MKISVSSYSFQQYIGTGRMSHFDTIRKAQEMGFEAIEFLDMPRPTYEEQLAYAADLRAEADACGMTINAYTIGACLYQDTPERNAAEVERLKRQVDIAAVLGCSVMRHDACYSLGSTGNARSFGLMLPTIAANIRAVTEYAATKGIRTAVENHGFVAQDSYRVEQLFNAVAHDNFGLLVDVGNFVCADEPLPGYGQTRACNYFKGAIIGEGDVNVEQCLRVLKRAGYDGYCSIEFEGSEDCIYGIETGLRNLRAMLERI